MEDTIKEMLIIPWPILIGIIGSTIVISKGITGTLKIHGWSRLYITIGVYTFLFLSYIFRDNTIFRYVVTYVVGLGGATGLYNISRKSKDEQNEITGGQTPIDPAFMIQEYELEE